MYPALVIKTPQRYNSRRSSAFIVNFEHMGQLALVFSFLTRNDKCFLGKSLMFRRT